AERHGKVWHLGPLWFAGNAQLATLVIGAAGVASGLSFSWSLVAIFLGAVIGTLFMAFHSAQGPKLGLAQMVVETLNVNKVVGAIIITALAFAFALLGYRLIHKFCQWASVLFIVVFVLFGIGLLAAVHLPAGFYSFGTFNGAPFLLEMGIILSYQLTWAPYVSEYSRYLPRSSTTAATFWWTYIGSGIGVLWLAGLGDFLAAAYPKII